MEIAILRRVELTIEDYYNIPDNLTDEQIKKMDEEGELEDLWTGRDIMEYLDGMEEKEINSIYRYPKTK